MKNNEIRISFEEFMIIETGYDLSRTSYPMTKPEDQMYKDTTVEMCWLSFKKAVDLCKNDS